METKAGTTSDCEKASGPNVACEAPTYPDTPITKRIKNDFTYHRPPANIGPVFVSLREKAKELALMIDRLVPPGREQSSALTRLEEAVMHANAGIARQYPVEQVQ